MPEILVTVCQREDCFIDAIRAERTKGLGFVPLIGAGLSAPSGIPVTHELKSYLQRCIASALGLNNPDVWSPAYPSGRTDFHAFRRWLPGRDQWPPFGGPQIIQRDSVDWQKRLSDVLVEQQRLRDDSESEMSLFQEAFGAMADWRSALLFLSRLRLRMDEGMLVLGAQEPDIIDTFFLNVILGKRPTLGHRMLARLASPLRMTTLLTTNFDDLIEQAFQEINQPLTSFDVHVDSGLPPYRDMQGKDSVIKLHGGRYGLRADYSLDAPPSDVDCRHFVEYLANHPIPESDWSRQSSDSMPASRHLFVIGCSARDERILRFIRVAAQKSSGLKIFWLCFSENDVNGAKKELEHLHGPDNKADGNPESHRQAFILRHRHFGLFFLQLYQELTRSLPSSGVIFPYAPQLPVPPEWSVRNESGAANDVEANEERVSLEETPDQLRQRNIERNRKTFEANVSNALDQCFNDEKRKYPRQRFILVSGEQGKLNGITTALANVYEQQLQRRQAIWIDLDETKGSVELFESIVHTIARKAGIVDWRPLLVHRQEVFPSKPRTQEPQISEVARLTNSPNRQWIIFLNARSGAGKNLEDDFETSNNNINPNGWLDIENEAASSVSDDAPLNSTGHHCLQLLKRLTGEECPNVAVVMSCYDGEFVEWSKGVIPLRLRPGQIRCRESLIAGIESVKATIDSAKEFSDTDEKARFLYAMCLTNRARYPAILWSRTFHGNNTTNERFTNTRKWLNDLAQRHIIRFKTGGFVWMHCEVRNGIRKALADNDKLKQLTVEIHQGLCEAYWRLFLSSDDAMAAFEAIYHQCLRIRAALSVASHLDETPQWLLEVRHLLELARPAMLAAGFTKGVCRWLVYLRKTLVDGIDDLVQKFEPNHQRMKAAVSDHLMAIRIESIKLQRDIAREVGEVAIAANRHRTLMGLVAGKLGIVNYDEIKGKIHQPETYTEIKDILTSIRTFHGDRTPTNGPQEPLFEWIDSELQLGILGIAARSYDFTSDCFGNVYQMLEIDPEELDPKTANPDTASRNNCLIWMDAKRKATTVFNRVNDTDNHHFQAALGLTKTLGRDIQLRLAWGQLLHLNSRRNISKATLTQATEQFEKAHRRYLWAVEVLRVVHQYEERRQWETEGYYIRKEDLHGWYDERQRLDTQHGVVQAYLGDFDKAHRRLNEAQAALRRTTSIKTPTELAIIELHRAEVYTVQACFEGNDGGQRNLQHPSGKPTALSELRWSILQKVANREELTDFLKSEDLRRFVESTLPDAKNVQKSLAFVEDAWQALDRAERLLDRHRKNVWWISWYFDLRMKLIELQLFGSLVGPRASLPHLGLEAVPYGFPTLADSLLDASRRMVRHDVFRFAHTVECYAHGLLAFYIWRHTQNADTASQAKLSLGQTASDSHFQRQLEMSKMLKMEKQSNPLDALSKIGQLKSVRAGYDVPWPTTAITKAATDYVTNVVVRVNNIIEAVKNE